MTAISMLGVAGLSISLILGAGAGIPLGVPPGPHDPFLFRIAPEECLYYTTWAGMAPPDASSENETEQLLAEAEVQLFLSELDRHVGELVRQGARDGDQQARLIADKLPLLIKAVMTHSTTVFLKDLTVGQDGMDAEAALVVSLGEAVGDFQDAIQQIEQVALETGAAERVEIDGSVFRRAVVRPGAPPIDWGVKGTYFIVGVGKHSIRGVLERANTPPPPWLERLSNEPLVERPATLTYANIERIVAVAAAAGSPRAKKVVQALDLTSFESYTTVAGLDKDGFVIRSRLKTSRANVMAGLLTGRPLTAQDVRGIPEDPHVACAIRLDTSKLVDWVLQVLDAVDPQAARNVEQGLAQFEQAVQVRLREELLAATGDVWTIHTAPASGGLLTGWIATLSLRDAAQFEETHGRLLAFCQGALQAQRNVPDIKTFRFQDQDVFTLNVPEQGFVFAPSWCVTESHLVVALLPQSIKSYLSRPENDKSIVDRPEIASLLSAETPPNAFSFKDTPRLFESWYPLLQLGAQVVAKQLKRQEIDVDPSILPSMASISPHLRPSLSSLRATDQELETISVSSLPGSSIGAVTPISVAFLLPAVQAAREAARRTQSMKNLKLIGLALHNYHSAIGSFPPGANVDDDGQPLLSWRVHLLPFIEEQALYDQFHLDEPWDSDHNRQLIQRMPTVYRSPNSVVEPGKTVYLGNAADNGIFGPPQATDRGRNLPSGTAMRKITDGTSKTIMMVEASDHAAVIWTKPGDLVPDPEHPFAGLTGMRPGGFLVGLCDGSVHFMSETIEKSTLNAMFTRNGGEIVDLP